MLDRLIDMIQSMTPVNKKIASYALNYKSEIGFMTVAQLSKQIGVSKASIVRFARLLDFEGFNDFKKAIQKDIKKELSPYEKIKYTNLDGLDRESQLEELVENEITNIESTFQRVKTADIIDAAEYLENAQRIFIAGFGMSTHLAKMFQYSLLSVFEKPVYVLSGSVSDFALQASMMKDTDILFLFTFPVYSREIIFVSGIAGQNSTPMLLLTDALTCPASRNASLIILCETSSLLRINSYVSPLAIMQIISNMLILDRKKAAEKKIKKVMDIEKEGYKNLDVFLKAPQGEN